MPGPPKHPLPDEGIRYARLDVEWTKRMHDAFRPRWRRQVNWTWTNWTFGIWWSSRRNRRLPYAAFGIDLGPLEVVWRQEPLMRHLNRKGRPRRASSV